MLPDLDEPADHSAASRYHTPEAHSANPGPQSAELPALDLERPALGAATLEGPRPGVADSGCQERDDSSADLMACPEVFATRRRHGRGGRCQHVLADSDEDAPGSPTAAAATWASDSSEVPISWLLASSALQDDPVLVWVYTWPRKRRICRGIIKSTRTRKSRLKQHH